MSDDHTDANVQGVIELNANYDDAQTEDVNSHHNETIGRRGTTSAENMHQYENVKDIKCTNICESVHDKTIRHTGDTPAENMHQYENIKDITDTNAYVEICE